MSNTPDERAALAPAPCSALRRAKLTDVTVYHLLKSGASLEEVIGALVADKERLVKRIMELESIAPRKVLLPDGRVMVWRCPDELIPALPNNLVVRSATHEKTE